MPPPSASPTTSRLDAQALEFARASARHRATLQSMAGLHPGQCVADAWQTETVLLDGDFDLDATLVEPLLRPGPHVSASPPPIPRPRGPDVAGMVQGYLYPPSPDAPAGSLARVGQEVPGAVIGPGNVLGNASAALAGALQGLGERQGRAALAEGIRRILAGQAKRVVLGPAVELYNAAARGQRPRVRLRVRGLPITLVQKMVPTMGGAANTWRVGAQGAVSSLKVQGMTAQQLRNTAILASEQRLPGLLRWTGGRVGGGVLAFAPSLALDAWSAIETDLATGERSFNGRRFLTDSARSQSGNALGFGAGLAVSGVAVVVGGAAAAASAPVVLLALGVGLLVQVAWNASGGADAAAGAAEAALR